MSKLSRGRPQSFPGRRYFKFISVKEAECQIQDDNGKICSAKITSADSPSNLRYHLKNHHESIWETIEGKTKSDQQQQLKQKSKSNQQQLTLIQSFNRKKSYESSSPEAIRINRALSLLLGGTNIPISIVDDPLFRNLMGMLDNRYTVPGRKKATKLVAGLREELDKKILQKLLEAKRVTITTDLWTKCDNTPFMGVTAHFYNRVDHRRYNIVIGLKALPHPHTGEEIFNTLMNILQFWKIDEEKVLKMITDNPSNMIKAFCDNSDADDISCNSEESVCELNESDSSENEEIGENYDSLWNLEQTYDEDAFDELQNDNEHFWTKKHLTCFMHSLQLVIRKFEKNYAMDRKMKGIHKLVTTIRKSSKKTQALKEISGGKGLRASYVTRWSSFYLMINRLLELREQVEIICKDYNIDGLQPSQWQWLANLSQILEPFADHTLELQANNSTTISLVYPAIKNLTMHLVKMKNIGVCKEITELLLSEHKKRFKHFTDLNGDQFNHVYLVATILDPRYKGVLNEQEKTKAKEFLAQELEVTEPNILPPQLISQDGPSSSKRFKNLSFDTDAGNCGNIKIITDEISSYIDNALIQWPEDNEPLDYWKSCTAFPTLADFAIDFLSIPCSSSASETLFSHAGILSSGLKNRVGEKNLENQVLLKCNWKLLF